MLAAGAGRRFGGRKLTATFEGRPLIAGALDAAFAAPARGVILATDGDPDLATIARNQARAVGRQADLAIVVVSGAAEGMGASLRAAALALPTDADGAFVFLGDMPRVPHAVLAPLAAAIEAGAPAAAPVFAGQRGNPVVLGRALFGDVAALRGDVGARPILQGLGAALAQVEAPDDGVLFDVDVREDLPR